MYTQFMRPQIVLATLMCRPTEGGREVGGRERGGRGGRRNLKNNARDDPDGTSSPEEVYN